MPRPDSLAIVLHRRASMTLQEELVFYLRERIQNGTLKGGASLPSSRGLATDLGISRNTVIAAYDRLLGEGYLESRERSGIYVNPCLLDGWTTSTRPWPLHRMKHTKTIITNPVPFHPCQPDVSLFPLGQWNRLRNRVLRRHGTSILNYQSQFALGFPSLRQSLANYLGESRGVRCDWRQIAVTTGSQQAIFLLSRLLLKPGDRVLLEDPGYPGALKAFEQSRTRVIPMRVDEHGAIPPHRITSAKLIYVTPSRQFPTGACQPVTRRMAILEYARKSGAWLIEDDYDSEFRYTRKPHPSLHSLDTSGLVIYIGSMSKVLFPSLRIGFVVLPERLVAGFEKWRLIAEDHGPFIDQATLAEFIDTGDFYRHIRRCRKAYAAKLETFMDEANTLKSISFPFTDGGINLTGFLNDSTRDSDALSHALSRAGLHVPSTGFYSMRKHKPGLVFGFTGFDHSAIRKGWKILRSHGL